MDFNIDTADQHEIDAKITPLFTNFFFPELIKLIDQSRLYIYAVQYQWKWNIHDRYSKIAQLGDAIARARKRGVAVSVVLNTESPLRNISVINRVSGRRLSLLGCQVKHLRAKTLLHTKMWLFDGECVLIGSHNISTRSLTANEEVSVKIKSKEIACLMRAYFERLWF